jgi:hypothetical protein
MNYSENIVVAKEEDTILDFEGNSSTYLHYPRLDMIKLSRAYSRLSFVFCTSKVPIRVRISCSNYFLIMQLLFWYIYTSMKFVNQCD